VQAHDLFTPSADFPFADFFSPQAKPWQWVVQVRRALEHFFSNHSPNLTTDIARGIHVSGSVWADPSAIIGPNTTLEGPIWLGAGVEVRPGAYLRGHVIADKGALLGHSCEFKNALLLEGCQVPHFNYVGDSIVGAHAHLGAGVICSNLRFDQKAVAVRDFTGQKIDTGIRKLGALLGDYAEVGCQSVLQPGAVLGRKALVYPLLSFIGTLAENSRYPSA
jgi:NDP-sugar pyrophosphorylase family protein